jgi:glycosyltransferase involved in cell wall biosynthesis
VNGSGPAGPGRAPRVTCVISALSVGGAERILTALADRWAAMGWSVTILTFAGPVTGRFFRPDPRVQERQLDLLATSRSPLSAIPRNLGRLLRLRRAIAATQPDAVLSFMDRTNVLTLLATVGQPWPVVVAERSAPEVGPGRAWGVLRRLAYPRAARVVVQTTSARASLPVRLQPKLAVIPNPALDAGTAEPVGAPVADPGGRAADGRAEDDDPDGRIVALGRLVPAKGFDLLLRAFAIVQAAQPASRLEIWGEGPDRTRLGALSRELGIADAVELPGETRSPATALARGCVFVLASRHEGFPNVLVEAMAQGIAVVAFDCRHGPAEIIRDGVDGALVPAGDVTALAAAILDMLTDPARRARLGSHAVEVRERFALERIGPMWDELLLPRDHAASARA